MSAARLIHNRRKAARRNARIGDIVAMAAATLSGLAAFAVLAVSFI